jgi:hypothetical protein
MKHGLGLDVLACPCGKRMRYLATIFDHTELQRLLAAKHLPHRIEPIRPARGAWRVGVDFRDHPRTCMKQVQTFGAEPRAPFIRAQNEDRFASSRRPSPLEGPLMRQA